MAQHEVASDPFGMPYVYDIVLSDFGRDSALDFFNEVRAIERDLVKRLVLEKNQPIAESFFDEYRRIMFTIEGDIAYVKADLLAKYKDSGQLLDSKILFGVGGTIPSPYSVDAIADVLVGVVERVARRGHREIRVLIPCNTLAFVEGALVRVMADRLPGFEVRRPEVGNGLGNRDSDRPRVTIYTPPRVVLNHVMGDGSAMKLLLIGTEIARKAYQNALEELGASSERIIDCKPEEQHLMDRLLIASIAGDRGRIADLTTLLEQEVVKPRQRDYKDALTVVDACTDVSTGIGANSLSIFARQLVIDVYPDARLLLLECRRHTRSSSSVNPSAQVSVREYVTEWQP